MKLVFLFTIAVTAFAQQTQRDMVMAELLSWRKAPLVAEAPAAAPWCRECFIDRYLLTGEHTAPAYFAPAYFAPWPRVVSSDILEMSNEEDLASTTESNDPSQMVMTNYVNFKPVMKIPDPRGELAPPIVTGVTVTFSSQGDAALKALTGKGLSNFQMIKANICATHDTAFSFGFVTQLANSIGIQDIGKETGTAVVMQSVNRNWKTLAPKVGSFLIATAVALTVGRVVPASSGWQIGLTLGHLAIDGLPALLGPTAPHPDPYLKSTAAGADKIRLAAGDCQEATFAGVYNGPGSNFVSPRLQLLP
jgi:hypothetical protein